MKIHKKVLNKYNGGGIDSVESYTKFLENYKSQFYTHTEEFKSNIGFMTKNYRDTYELIKLRNLNSNSKMYNVNKSIMFETLANDFEIFDFDTNQRTNYNLRKNWLETVLFTWFLYNTNDKNANILKNWSYVDVNKEFFIVINLLRQFKILDIVDNKLHIKFSINDELDKDIYIEKFPYDKNIHFDKGLHLKEMILDPLHLSGWFIEEIYKIKNVLNWSDGEFKVIIKHSKFLLKFIATQVYPLINVLLNKTQYFLTSYINEDFIIRSIIFECTNLYFGLSFYEQSMLSRGKQEAVFSINNYSDKKNYDLMKYPFYSYKSFDTFKIDNKKLMELFEIQNRYVGLKFIEKKTKDFLKNLTNDHYDNSKKYEIFKQLFTSGESIKTLKKNILMILKEFQDLNKDNIVDIYDNKLYILMNQFYDTFLNFEYFELCRTNIFGALNNFLMCINDLLLAQSMNEIQLIKGYMTNIKNEIFDILEKESQCIVETKETLKSAADTNIVVQFRHNNRFIVQYYIHLLISLFNNSTSKRINFRNNVYILGESFDINFDRKKNYIEHNELLNTSLKQIELIIDNILEIIYAFELSKEYNLEFYNILKADFTKTNFFIEKKSIIFHYTLEQIYETNQIYNVLQYSKDIYKIFMSLLINDKVGYMKIDYFKCKILFFTKQFKNFLRELMIQNE